MGATLLLRSSRVLMLVAILIAALTPLVAALYSRDAQLASRVEPATSATSALFGGTEAHTVISTPQMLVIRDPRAFLPERGARGERLVNEIYLRENGLYPLQLKTVVYIRNLVLLMALGMFVVGAVLGVLARMQRNKRFASFR